MDLISKTDRQKIETLHHDDRILSVKKGLTILRNKAFAHHDDTLDSDATFKKANITRADLSCLLNCALNIVNILLVCHGLPRTRFDGLAAEDAELLLADLKRA